METIIYDSKIINHSNNIAMEEKRSRYMFEGAQCFVNILDPDKFPRYLKKAEGPYVWDVDNNKYIDLFLGSGTIILGHGNEEQIHEVTGHLQSGAGILLRHPVEVELAEWLTGNISFADRVVFFKTGSESTFIAVQIAHMISHKKKIISLGYHGWLPPFRNFKRETNFNWQGDLIEISDYCEEKVEEAFLANKDDVAAIIVTPNSSNFSASFYHFLEKISKENNALFIVDEVKCGFRAKFPCFSEFIGIKPDICTFAKAFSNGFPISTLVCKEEVYKKIEYYNFSTYAGEPLSMVAALKNIKLLEAGKFHEYEIYSQYLFDKLTEILQGSKIKITGIPTFIRLVYPDDDYANSFIKSLANMGVLVHPEGEIIISASHNYKVLDEVLEKIKQVISEIENEL